MEAATSLDEPARSVIGSIARRYFGATRFANELSWASNCVLIRDMPDGALDSVRRARSYSIGPRDGVLLCRQDRLQCEIGSYSRLGRKLRSVDSGMGSIPELAVAVL